MQDNTIKEMNKSYPNASEDVGNIREDLKSIKSNVGKLATHIKEEVGNAKDEGFKTLTKVARDEYENMAKLGRKIEGQVKDQPAKSLGVAFIAGLFASYLFGRR